MSSDWEGVNQELVSDKDECNGDFKVKTPVRRSYRLNNLIKKLDRRRKEKSEKKNTSKGSYNDCVPIEKITYQECTEQTFEKKTNQDWDERFFCLFGFS